jgi:molybdate transport system substrate-binding protein
MFEELGIAAAVKSKLQLLPPGQAAERVGAGQAEVVLTLVSEILPVEGVELVGALPAEFQGNVAFAGALSPKPANAAAATQFINYLSSAEVTPVLKKKGMER